MAEEIYPRIVTEATKAPGQCLASRDAEGPFIDTGLYAAHHNPYIYLSVPWLEQTAKDVLGMVPAKEVQERYAALEAEIKAYAEKLADLQRFEEAAVEYEAAKERLAV